MEGSHHSHVHLHTHQTEEQRLHNQHQRNQQSHHDQHIVTLPQIVICKECRQDQIEGQMGEGQVEGEEVCRKDASNL